MSEEERLQFLRERGVLIETVEDRKKQAEWSSNTMQSDGPIFEYVHIPADVHSPVTQLTEHADAQVGDVLKRALAPRFADNASMDDEVVAREVAGRMRNMLQGGVADGPLKTPSAATMQQVAAGGACEAYPLSQPTEANGWQAVRLYIDEVGALRSRPRNARAEALAAAAGLVGLSIHGDAYVGRCARAPQGGEQNVSFTLPELAHDSAWVVDARTSHARAAAAAGHGEAEHLPSGDAGVYAWSQNDDDVEVRVHGAPTGRGSARRVNVDFARGTSLRVCVDGAELLNVPKLFDRVLPDDCNWTLDGTDIVITLEKAEARPWAGLSLDLQ